MNPSLFLSHTDLERRTMVKFSKELEAQLIPEWRDAFVNYWQLKKNVKKIRLSKKQKQSLQQQHEHEHEHDFGFSILDPIRYVLRKVPARFRDNDDKTPEIVQVMNINKCEEGDEEEPYEAESVQIFSEEDELKEFFERLDEELNKVNTFYKTKEKELVERGDLLKQQLDSLHSLKQIVHDRRKKNLQSRVNIQSDPPSLRGSDYSDTSCELDDVGSPVSAINDLSPTLERNRINIMGTERRAMSVIGKPKSGVKIDIPATTPARTITAVTSMLYDDLAKNYKKNCPGDLFFIRKKTESAEKMIRKAFVELYRGLGLLRTYSSLNMVAFTKILKKFDKVSNQQASANYLKKVKRSHFISSDKVVLLGDEVESIFTKHFANNDKIKAMKFLRPQQRKESHMLSFLVGLSTGCFVTLFCMYAIFAHFSGMFAATSEDGYMETIYPVFSMFALLSLHLFCYGCNLYMWRGTRINYNFIFEFSPSTSLKYRDVFLICTSIMTAVVGTMVIHLISRSSVLAPSHIDAIPGVLFLFFTGLLICPLNFFYRSSRYCFLRVIRNIVCSPFYKVLMVDFFMADQLTSQIPLLRHMESTACYFLSGSFKTHQYETCHTSKLFKEFAYIVSFLPYFWRAMQCLRRWFDESEVDHLANLGKYVSAMIAAGVRLTFALYPTQLWWCMALVTSSLATVYQLYWDFVKDWGLFNRSSKNYLLRDELILKNKSSYYMSIVINMALRVVWVESVMHFNMGTAKSRLVDFVLASLEIIRRGHWNFYRLENEHLNNVGKYRAVNTVPLPFRDIDSDY
ncbi:hypothetical protein GIB67_034169 [Kingdonia uniflora]|uniref:Phosphate transporter PHO1 n=1 Tax=Kingdonia uniflora TaxID=39325 RepID=A0A7J7NRD2_9MAGN|nr:hypothetical protein GIB67_034169 [Kingdonia uniflora]